MANCSTLYNEHMSCEMSVASQNQYTEQRNAPNGHCTAAYYHKRGEEVNYRGKNSVVGRTALLLLCKGGGWCRVQIWARKCYPDGILFASLPPRQHNSTCLTVQHHLLAHPSTSSFINRSINRRYTLYRTSLNKR